METLLLATLVLGIGLLLYSKMAMIEERIKRHEKLLERLTSQMKIEDTTVPDEVLIPLREGKDVQAVKAARERFGYSLLEAKQYVDGVKREENIK